jgi:hypothetical protein
MTNHTKCLGLLTVLVWLLAIESALAAEYITDEQPAADSVTEQKEPMSKGIEKEIEVREVPPFFFPDFKRKIKSLPSFWRDTELSLNPRSYYFHRNNVDTNRNEAWALGGSLDYKSGWWKDRFQVRAVGYTSQKLCGPGDRDGTGLLKPGQESFSVLGQAYLTARISEEIRLRLYRQTFNLPYVNRQDSRMVPNTFEGYSLIGNLRKRTDFIVSHLTRMKTRNSSKFLYMSEAAGFDDTDDGLTLAGARYSFTEEINIGAITYYSWNFMNTAYAEAHDVWKLTDEAAIRLSAQYTDQRSVGDELGGDFSTDVFGARLAMSYEGAILSFAFSSTDNDSRIRSPFGGYPGYLSLMEKDFNRAGEDAWLVGLSSDFRFGGIKGLSAFVKYARGNTRDSGSNASPDQAEIDMTVDYRFNNASVEGLWLRVRGAYVNQDGPGGQDIRTIRAILNYSLPIL